MAQERKASDSGAAASRGLRSPIPSAKKDDLEDVAWALSTAEAMWSRGEQSDALKWIRRAAEAASEAEADDRALELAKAAADVASLLSDRPTTLAPPPTAPVPQVLAAPVIPAAPTPGPPPVAPKPPPPPPAGMSPAPPKVAVAAAPPLPRAVPQKGPTPPRAASPPASKRGSRRSSPSFADETEAAKGLPLTARKGGPAAAEPRRRARSSRPAPDETSQHAPVTARHPSVNEIDAWPTQSIVDEDDDDPGQHTRIGEPAYQATAQRASGRPPGMVQGPPLIQSQALRVVVWRSPDGVRVAPVGTHVSAITVEAVLVALDPGTDLAAWLGNK